MRQVDCVAVYGVRLCDSIQVYVYEVGRQHYCVTVIL